MMMALGLLLIALGLRKRGARAPKADVTETWLREQRRAAGRNKYQGVVDRRRR